MSAPTAEESRALLEPLTGYTPGPWDASGLIVYDTCMDGVASCHANADARLIAAAPDLAAHLRAALDREAAALARAEKAEAEVLDQARLNGMGAERELKLMAEQGSDAALDGGDEA